jgi:uncharacterized protein YcfJ
MSIISTKVNWVLAAAALAVSTGAFAQDRYDGRYDDRDESRYDDGAYEYARVIDVDPIVHRVRVSTPQQECWNETRYEQPRYENSPQRTGSTLLGAAIGAVIGHQIGHGDGRRVATVAGAVVGGAIGRDQADRRTAQNGYGPQPRGYDIQRCETRYAERWEERTDGYRVTYVYNGRRQVTELPYRPGNRIRVRVDVSPAQ